jgi:BRCA1/BRCA2-containing complex subunit 3
MRCERKKDRVEVNPELLAAASAQAEISFSPLPFSFLRFCLFLSLWFCVEWY